MPVAHPPAVSPRLGQDSALEGARVWVIDNDPGICAGMAALLEGWGCRVLTATSLAVLEGKAAGERADVLLVDFHLGEEDPDGLAVAARLRERQPGLAVMVITANHDATIKGHTRQLGYGYLLKPLKPLRLRMALVALLAGDSA